MQVKDFLKKYPNDNFQMMTPGGYVDLSSQQAKELLAGKPVAAHPGESGCKMMVDAEELLMESVLSANWRHGTCYMLTDLSQEAEPQKEVDGMLEHDKEQKLKERIKAGYETYIQQLKTKPAPDLIEMASEIAAAKFVYEGLSVDGVMAEYADYLLQFENPFEVVRDEWHMAQEYDHHEELDHVLWRMADQGIGESEYQMAENNAECPSLEQGVTMC